MNQPIKGLDISPSNNNNTNNTSNKNKNSPDLKCKKNNDILILLI